MVQLVRTNKALSRQSITKEGARDFGASVMLPEIEESSHRRDWLGIDSEISSGA